MKVVLLLNQGGVIIGSGSVVTKDIPARTIAAGNPCRVIREITDEDRQYWEDALREYLEYESNED